MFSASIAGMAESNGEIEKGPEKRANFSAYLHRRRVFNTLKRVPDAGIGSERR